MARSTALKHAQSKYQAKRQKDGTIPLKIYSLKCHIINDADIIAAMDLQTNKNGYLKKLIRNDIKRQG